MQAAWGALRFGHLRHSRSCPDRGSLMRSCANGAKGGIRNWRVQFHPAASDIPLAGIYGQRSHARMDAHRRPLQSRELERGGRARSIASADELESGAITLRIPDCSRGR